MENLHLKKTKQSPEIFFSKKTNVFKISGRSLVQSPYDFFKPAQDWIADYRTQPNPKTILEINLEYFNSGTLKQLFQLIYQLEEMNEEGYSAKVFWYYKKGDELIQKKGLEFQRYLSITVELVAFD